MTNRNKIRSKNRYIELLADFENCFLLSCCIFGGKGVSTWQILQNLDVALNVIAKKELFFRNKVHSFAVNYL